MEQPNSNELDLRQSVDFNRIKYQIVVKNHTEHKLDVSTENYPTLEQANYKIKKLIQRKYEELLEKDIEDANGDFIKYYHNHYNSSFNERYYALIVRHYVVDDIPKYVIYRNIKKNGFLYITYAKEKLLTYSIAKIKSL